MNRLFTHHRVAIIQARTSSSRLPGKVLAPLLGLPMIVFMARRVRCASLVDEVVVATSTDSSDDQLASSLTDHGIPCVRGNLQDVLDRFRTTARKFDATQVVRLTGDCPLIDPDLVDRALTLLTDSDAHYVSNISPPTYPDGLDVEAFTMSTLEYAWKHARLPSEREHVTLFMRAGHDHIRTAAWSALADLSSLRWTVDHADDLDYVRSLLALAKVESELAFDRFDLYRTIERAQLGSGANHRRNEGLDASLSKDLGISTY